mgnify:CR=1 FL=1
MFSASRINLHHHFQKFGRAARYDGRPAFFPGFLTSLRLRNCKLFHQRFPISGGALTPHGIFQPQLHG